MCVCVCVCVCLKGHNVVILGCLEDETPHKQTFYLFMS